MEIIPKKKWNYVKVLKKWEYIEEEEENKFNNVKI